MLKEEREQDTRTEVQGKQLIAAPLHAMLSG